MIINQTLKNDSLLKRGSEQQKVIHRVIEEMSDRDSGTEAVVSVDDVVVAVG